MSDTPNPETVSAVETVNKGKKTAKDIKPAAPKPRASSSPGPAPEETTKPKPSRSFTDDLMEEAGWTPE